MSLEYIIAGDYGQVLKLTFIDVDTNAAADISGYSNTIQMIFTSPSGTSTTKSASFDSDGSDGIIKHTVEQSFLTEGIWTVRGRVASASAVLTSMTHTFRVHS